MQSSASDSVPGGNTQGNWGQARHPSGRAVNGRFNCCQVAFCPGKGVIAPLTHADSSNCLGTYRIQRQPFHHHWGPTGLGWKSLRLQSSPHFPGSNPTECSETFFTGNLHRLALQDTSIKAGVAGLTSPQVNCLDTGGAAKHPPCLCALIGNRGVH